MPGLSRSIRLVAAAVCSRAIQPAVNRGRDTVHGIDARRHPGSVENFQRLKHNGFDAVQSHSTKWLHLARKLSKWSVICLGADREGSDSRSLRI